MANRPGVRILRLGNDEDGFLNSTAAIFGGGNSNALNVSFQDGEWNSSTKKNNWIADCSNGPSTPRRELRHGRTGQGQRRETRRGKIRVAKRNLNRVPEGQRDLEISGEARVANEANLMKIHEKKSRCMPYNIYQSVFDLDFLKRWAILQNTSRSGFGTKISRIGSRSSLVSTANGIIR